MKMSEIRNSQILRFSLLLLLPISMQISLDEYLTLTPEQKFKLDQFRDSVIDLLPHDYMKREIYLIRWLREKDFDVGATKQHLLKHISWRADNDMDHILEEDWSDFDFDFVVSLEGCDREGRPIVSMRVGDWDVRRYVLAGKLKKLMRYVDKIFEEGEIMVRRMQDDGQNVTQGVTIFELSNFNLIEQGCPRCLPAIYHIAKTFTDNFSGFAHRIFGVNTPSFAMPIWEVLKSFISHHTRDVLDIYGKDISEWRTALLKEIDENQLSRSFGGKRIAAVDFQGIRATGEVLRCENLNK